MAQVHRLKVTLRGVRPPVWRRIEVASDTSLARLHHVLQIAMGWTDSHLHRFDTRHGAYGPMDIDEPDWRDERRTTLAKVAPDAGTTISYEYDFGDGWVHDVAVEDVGDADPAIHYPRCLTGRRACPPEDVGGPWGYQEFLAAPGDDFDAEAFSADAGTDALQTALGR